MVSLFLEDITEYSPEKYLTSTLDNILLIDLSQKLYDLLEYSHLPTDELILGQYDPGYERWWRL